MAEASTTTTSPPTGWPPDWVWTVAVLSPGSAGVMKRDTYARPPSAATATWRGFGPTARLASVAPVAASILSRRPVASSATYMTAPVGEAEMPWGWDAAGNAIVRSTSRVPASMTVIEADSLFVTQTSPFGAMAIERGAVPTLTCVSRVPVAVLKTLTESLSWLTTHRRSAPVGRSSMARFDEAAGRFAVSG